jgi:hypothetical protein
MLIDIKLIKMADAVIKNIDLFGSAEEPRTKVSVKAPMFYNTKTLAGTRVNELRQDTFESKRKLVTDALNSAKGIKMNVEHKLPWQYDTDGKLYSTDMEKLRFKVTTLRNKLLKIKDQNKPDTDAKRIALLNTYYPLKMELELLEAESKFKKGLYCWVLGEGKFEEYDKCYWIKDIYDPRTNKRMNLREIEDQLTNGYLFTRDEDKAHYKNLRFQLTQTMMRANPNLTQGMIEQSDNLEFKAKAFIDYLKQTLPKTDEEAYLFYKYIVLSHKLDFDYICEPTYVDFIMKNQPKLPPNIPIPPPQPPRQYYLNPVGPPTTAYETRLLQEYQAAQALQAAEPEVQWGPEPEPEVGAGVFGATLPVTLPTEEVSDITVARAEQRQEEHVSNEYIEKNKQRIAQTPTKALSGELLHLGRESKKGNASASSKKIINLIREEFKQRNALKKTGVTSTPDSTRKLIRRLATETPATAKLSVKDLKADLLYLSKQSKTPIIESQMNSIRSELKQRRSTTPLKSTPYSESEMYTKPPIDVSSIRESSQGTSTPLTKKSKEEQQIPEEETKQPTTFPQMATIVAPRIQTPNPKEIGQASTLLRKFYQKTKDHHKWSDAELERWDEFVKNPKTAKDFYEIFSVETIDFMIKHGFFEVYNKIIGKSPK